MTKRLLDWIAKAARNQLVIGASLIWVMAASLVDAAPTRVLSGHVPPAVRNLPPRGRVAPEARLSLAIGLPLRNKSALTSLLERLYDPESPDFHQYLNPARFAELFGPTEADYQGVISFAISNNLKLKAAHPNRVLLEVEGTAGDIERAFGVHLNLYQHPGEDRLFFAPDADPSVSQAVPILDISGMDNFVIPRPMSINLKSAAHGPAPNSGSGTGGSYRGGDFRAAYLPGVSLTGVGQTVGLLEFDGYYASDIASYESQAGLASVPLQNILLNNFSGSPGGNNVEVALDIEVAIAMAPGLSKVMIYEGTQPNSVLNKMATDNVAKQLSSSWTYGVNATSENIYRQFAAQGQTMFQASGDSGAYAGAIATPADDPNLTIVGGTTLSTTGPNGGWGSETAWNWANTHSGTSATGGGISTSYSIPSWQSGMSMSASKGSTTMRNTPDVALTADNIMVVYNNGTSGVVGGTSAAAPLWAGFMALVNQQALAGGQANVGFLNPALYSLAKGAAFTSGFHDITTGNNTNSSSPTKFFSATGYDLCTGWGTPTGQFLINALSGNSNTAPIFLTNPFKEPTVNVGQSYASTISTNASDSNPTNTLKFAKVSGPIWLIVAGDGSLSGPATNATVGTNTFVVSVTDSGGLSNTATLLINVNGAPSFTSNPFTEPGINAKQAYSGSIANKITDPNPGDLLSLRKVSGPAWLSVAINGAMSGTPASTDAGTNSFVVSVTDSGGLSNTATMAIKVNGAPSFSSNPVKEPSASAGQLYSASLASQATDPNPGDILSFAKVSGPGWLSIAGNGALSGTPANGDLGTNIFLVSVTDSGGLSNSAALYISVIGAPLFAKPVFSAPAANVNQAYTASIAGQASDPNPGATPMYGKASGPGWLAVAPDGTLSGTPALTDTGTNSFVVTVGDSNGLTNTATLLIRVNGAPYFKNDPFVLPTATVDQPYSGSLTNQATDPNPGDVLTFAKVSGPAWLGVSTNGLLSGAPTSADASTNTFRLSVTDSGGLSNSATMSIVVLTKPTPITVQVSSIGKQISLTWAGGNGPYQVQAATNLGSPAWLNVGSATTNYSLSFFPSNTPSFYRVQGH